MSTTAEKLEASPSPREATPPPSDEADGKSPSPPLENDANKETTPTSSTTTEPEKTMPQFSYTKSELMEIAQTPLAKQRPTCLDPSYDNAFGVWDPEKWFLGKRRAESPLQDDIKAKREKPSETERDSLYYKRRLSDPKERIKEEQDIILSPQRRSFGTGCHVTPESSSRRPESPCDLRSKDRDSFRDPGRRIGSGRIISRDRDARQDRDFGFRSGDNNRHDRFDRDDREMRFGGRSSRDYPERRGRGRHQRIEEEDEPEWFTGGPTSQLETIELHGFEDAEKDQIARDEAEGRGSTKRWRRGNARKNKPIIEEKDIPEEDEKEEDTAAERAKSAAAKEKLAAQEAQKSAGSARAVESAEFDMNKMFEDSLPAFMPNDTPPDSRRGSRFSQWFRSESPTIMDDLNAGRGGNELAYETYNSNTTNSQDQSKSILVDLLRKSPVQSTDAKSDITKNNKLQELVMSGQAHNVHEIEAELKQLVLGNRPPESSSSNNEVSSTPPPRTNEEDLSAFKKLLAQISEGHAQPVQPGSRAFEALDKNRMLQEKDVVQMSNKMQENHEAMSPVVSSMMGKNATSQMRIPKDAPTEQDILAGNIKGQLPVHPPAPPTSSAGGGATSYPDFLMRFLQQPSVVAAPMPQQQQASNHDDALCKLLMNNPSLRSSSPAFQDLLGGQLKRADMGAYPSGAPGNQPVRPQLGGPSTISNKMMQQRQHQREILASIVKQQQQQQQQLQQAAATAVQLQPPPPLLSQPPAPSPPAPHLNRVLSPSSQQSPHVADALTAQTMFQPAPTRIPSPLIFGQTPPLLSHAPSPIHPGQVGASMGNSLNPNTLQVYNHQLVQRVPSPQELVLHTQQIMQNALIKSKLEEQKENFRKRQEMQRSPNVPNLKVSSENSPTKMAGLSTTMAAFTPTSVMRKMHADKDKEGGSKLLDGGLQHSFAVDSKFAVQSVQQQTLKASTIPTSISGGGGGGNSMMEVDKMPRPLHGQGIMHSQVPARTVAPNNLSSGQMGRPIVKATQGGVGGICAMASNKNSVIPNPKLTTSAVPMNLVQSKSTGPGINGNFDVNKLMEHQRLVQRQLSVSPMPSTPMPHSSFPVRGGTAGIHPNMRSASVNFTPANLLAMRSVHPNVNQVNQAALRARLNQMALQQAIDSHRHNMSLPPNTLQSMRLGPGGPPCQQPSNMQGSLVGMVGTKPDGQSLSLSANNCGLNNNLASSGHNSSGASVVPSSCHSPVNNLSKWFNSEVLKQKLPDMPTVPKQKALSLEEVERLQQQTAVHN